ncbi:hypothetical protein H2198_002290 [Neophaeococcomyces mojaviensis]|uniref:Uncharacterized protein n=1 Tax=Neophaeococcomyces mojaviensis TaxID=3383035 RepID=A0ACC3AER6_9EURO|nr:hypothetical protein H2198_002290 [Knufia sp. JES_112]
MAWLGRKTGLEDCIIVQHQGHHLLGDVTIGTAIEALIAAVYLDGGDEALKAVMERFSFDHPLLRPWSEQSLGRWRGEERKRLALRKTERAKTQLNGQRKRIDVEKERIEAALGWRK